MGDLHAALRVRRPDFTPRTIDNATLLLLNLPPGSWTVEHFDTQRGSVAKTVKAYASPERPIRIELPTISADCALRLRAD